MNPNIKLVCFDLDDTLIRENSWSNLHRAMGVTPEEDTTLYNLYKEGSFDYKTYVGVVANIYKKRGQATIEAITQSVSNYTLREGAAELIAHLKQKGYHLAIISGSFDIMVDQVAEELSIDLAEATNIFVFDEHNYLEDIVTFGHQDLAKLRHLESFCRKLGIDITECACIGDGANDLEMFKRTGHGITFSDSPIKDQAWQTVTKLEGIKNIL